MELPPLVLRPDARDAGPTKPSTARKASGNNGTNRRSLSQTRARRQPHTARAGPWKSSFFNKQIDRQFLREVKFRKSSQVYIPPHMRVDSVEHKTHADDNKHADHEGPLSPPEPTHVIEEEDLTIHTEQKQQPAGAELWAERKRAPMQRLFHSLPLSGLKSERGVKKAFHQAAQRNGDSKDIEFFRWLQNAHLMAPPRDQGCTGPAGDVEHTQSADEAVAPTPPVASSHNFSLPSLPSKEGKSDVPEPAVKLQPGLSTRSLDHGGDGIRVGDLAGLFYKTSDETTLHLNALQRQRLQELEAKGPEMQEVPPAETTASVDIMSHLDHTKLALIKRDFKALGDELSVQEFVAVMSSYISQDDFPGGREELVACLIQFFSDVDVNGDGTMDWGEFTSFIIETGRIGSSGKVSLSAKAVIQQYEVSTAAVDVSGYRLPIHSMRYFEPLDVIAAFDRKTPVVKLYGAENLGGRAQLHGHKGEILSAEYVDFASSNKWIATSSNDRTIRFWNAMDNYKPVNFILQDNLSNLSLRWLSKHQLLLGGNDQSKISVWGLDYEPDPNAEMEFVSALKSTLAGHTDVVLDMATLENQSHFSSASLDTTIALWDIQAERRLSQLVGHSKGVFQLSYHHDYHMLFSAGFETDAIAWNPYCSRRICNLEGHYHPLTAIQAINGTPQFITADVTGVVKVWDIRNFGCVQSFNVEDNDGHRLQRLSGLVSCSSRQRLVFGGNHLIAYDSHSTQAERHPALADHDATVDVLHNERTGSFVTASANRLKIWKEETGCAESIYTNIGSEITSIAFDPAQKKLLVGDASGQIRIVNFLNGSVTKQLLPAHTKPVVSAGWITVGETKEQSLIVTTSWDGTIMVFDEGGVDANATLVNQTQTQRGDITCSAYSLHLQLFATGTNEGAVQVWEVGSRNHTNPLELLTIIEGHTSCGEITAVCFLNPYPILCVCDAQGNVCLWAVRPLLNKSALCIARWVNTARNSPDLSQARAVTVVRFVPDNGSCDLRRGLCRASHTIPSKSSHTSEQVHTHGHDRLYLGDGNGDVRVWCVGKTLFRWNVFPYQPPSDQASLYTNPTSARVDAFDAKLAHRDSVLTQWDAVPASDSKRSLSMPPHLVNGREASYKRYRNQLYRSRRGNICQKTHEEIASLIDSDRPAEGAQGPTTVTRKKQKLPSEAYAHVIGRVLAPGDFHCLGSWHAHDEAIRAMHLIESGRFNPRGVLGHSDRITPALSVAHNIRSTNSFSGMNTFVTQPEVPAPTASEDTRGEAGLSTDHEKSEPLGDDECGIQLMTCGFDKVVRLWGISGARLGQLEQGRTHTREKASCEFKYKAHSTLQQKKERTTELARELLSQIESQKDDLTARLGYEPLTCSFLTGAYDATEDAMALMPLDSKQASVKLFPQAGHTDESGVPTGRDIHYHSEEAPECLPKPKPNHRHQHSVASISTLSSTEPPSGQPPHTGNQTVQRLTVARLRQRLKDLKRQSLRERREQENSMRKTQSLFGQNTLTPSQSPVHKVTDSAKTAIMKEADAGFESSTTDGEGEGDIGDDEVSDTESLR